MAFVYQKSSRDLNVTNNLSAGVVDFALRANPNFNDKANGCSKLENLFVRNTGGVAKRPGLRRTNIEVDIANFDYQAIPFDASGDERFVLLAGIKTTTPDDGQLQAKVYRVAEDNTVSEVATLTMANPFQSSGVSAKDFDYAIDNNLIILVHPAMPPVEIAYNTGEAAWSMKRVTVINPAGAAVDMTFDEAVEEFGASRVYEIPQDANEVEFRPRTGAPTSLVTRKIFPTGENDDKIENYYRAVKSYYVKSNFIDAPQVLSFTESPEQSLVPSGEQPPALLPFRQPIGVFVTPWGGDAGFPGKAVFYNNRLVFSGIPGNRGAIVTSFANQFFSFVQERGAIKSIPLSDNPQSGSANFEAQRETEDRQPDFGTTYRIPNGSAVTALVQFSGGLLARSDRGYNSLVRTGLSDRPSDNLRTFVDEFGNGGHSRLKPIVLENVVLDYDRRKRRAFYFFNDGDQYRSFAFGVGKNPDLLSQSPVRKMARYFREGKTSLVLMLREDGRLLAATTYSAENAENSKQALAEFVFADTDTVPAEIMDMASVSDDALLFIMKRQERAYLEIFDPSCYKDVEFIPTAEGVVGIKQVLNAEGDGYDIVEFGPAATDYDTFSVSNGSISGQPPLIAGRTAMCTFDLNLGSLGATSILTVRSGGLGLIEVTTGTRQDSAGTRTGTNVFIHSSIAASRRYGLIGDTNFPVTQRHSVGILIQRDTETTGCINLFHNGQHRFSQGFTLPEGTGPIELVSRSLTAGAASGLDTSEVINRFGLVVLKNVVGRNLVPFMRAITNRGTANITSFTNLLPDPLSDIYPADYITRDQEGLLVSSGKDINCLAQLLPPHVSPDIGDNDWDWSAKTYQSFLASLGGDAGRQIGVTIDHMTMTFNGQNVVINKNTQLSMAGGSEADIVGLVASGATHSPFSGTTGNIRYRNDWEISDGLIIQHNGNSPFELYRVVSKIKADAFPISVTR